MSEFTKEYYEEKVEKMIGGMYASDNPLACDIFKRKLSYYEARIEYFERVPSSIPEFSATEEVEF